MVMTEKSQLLSRAQTYAKSRNIILRADHTLGYGSDGTVWQSNRPSAIKVLENEKPYRTEKGCYLRLQSDGVSSLEGLTIPALIDFDDQLMVLEIEIVRPPFLLDFGKAYLDVPPPYWGDQQIVANMHAEGRELFERDWPRVLSVLAALRRLGIYYVDPKPGNISFGDETELG
jgi:hypothetical protein